MQSGASRGKWPATVALQSASHELCPAVVPGNPNPANAELGVRGNGATPSHQDPPRRTLPRIVAPAPGARSNPGGAVRQTQLSSDARSENEQSFREQFSIPTLHMAQVLFRAIDLDGSGDVSPEEFAEFVSNLTSNDSSPAGVISLFIQLIDINGDGDLSEQELRDMIELHDTTGTVVDSLVSAVLSGGRNSITCEELHRILMRPDNRSCIEYLRRVMRNAFSGVADGATAAAAASKPTRATTYNYPVCIDDTIKGCSVNSWAPPVRKTAFADGFPLAECATTAIDDGEYMDVLPTGTTSSRTHASGLQQPTASPPRRRLPRLPMMPPTKDALQQPTASPPRRSLPQLPMLPPTKDSLQPDSKAITAHGDRPEQPAGGRSPAAAASWFTTSASEQPSRAERPPRKTWAPPSQTGFLKGSPPSLGSPVLLVGACVPLPPSKVSVPITMRQPKPKPKPKPKPEPKPESEPESESENKPVNPTCCITPPSGDTVAVALWWTLFVMTAVGRSVSYSHHYDAGVDRGHDSMDHASPTTALSVAKGTGLALLLAFPAIYLTRLHLVAYCFWAWFRMLATSTKLHAHIGASIFGMGLVHSTAHFAKGENGTAPLFGEHQLRTTLTGLGLLAIVVLMSISSFRRVATPSAFRPFLMAHMLHYLTVPLLIAHMPARWYVLGTLLLLLVCYEGVRHNQTITGSVEDCRRVGSSVTALSMPYQASYSKIMVHTLPGAYYKVKVPSVSWWESHPFSLSTSSFGITKEFLIKDLGKWTKAVGRLVVDASGEKGVESARVKVSGPYYAPTMSATTEERALLVATGIGITPFLSIVHHTIFENAALSVISKVTDAVFGEQAGRSRRGSETELGTPVRAANTKKKRRATLLGLQQLQEGADLSNANVEAEAYAAAATVGNASPMGLGHRGASSADPGFAEKEAAYNPRVSEGDLPLPRANQSRRTKSVLLIWVVRETSLVAFFLRYVAIPLPDTFPIVNCVATTFPGVMIRTRSLNQTFAIR